jgi:uncharacterized repeat protein (TIGR02543 family)
MPLARSFASFLKWICVPACAATLVATSLAGRPQLNEAPTAPDLAAAPVAPESTTPEVAAPNGFVIAPSSREASRIFYRTVYAASENVPIGWNGNVATGNAGTTSAAFKDAVQRRVNWFRAMAGIPAGITFDATFSSKDQQAALMMSANNSLSHSPPPTWTYYTAGGAEAAGKSNIFLGSYGPKAITGYIEDFGSPNASVGHRRWILYPQTQTMGTGDIPPGDVYDSANALWVVTSDFGTTRPAVRDEFVAWPPPGFVPHALVFPRWSFSYPGATFTSATVTMQRGGNSVPVNIQSTSGGAGESSIVWAWDGLDANQEMGPSAPPASDTSVQVNVNGVVINGQSRNFAYTVTLFDPEKPGVDTVLAQPSGGAQATVAASNVYTCNAIPNASGHQWRSAVVGALTATEGAENGTGNVVVNAPAGYAVIASAYHAGGTKAFHLTTPDFGSQSVKLSRTVLASASTELKFKSRFLYATPSQVAHVQVSTDEGSSWDTLFSDAGTDAPASSFSDHTIPLAAYANRTLQVRFVFAYEGGGLAYTDTATNIGWYFDDVSFSNAQELTGAALSAVTGTSFAFTPSAEGSYVLQTRGQFFGDYLFEWGPALPVAAVVNASPKISTHPANRTASVGASAQFSVVASGAGTLSYQWFHGTQPISDSNHATLTIPVVGPADEGSYHVEVTNAFGTTPSNAATLTVTIPNPVVTTLAGSALSESEVKLSGHVEVTAQTVTCGFEYGTTSSLGTTTNAGAASLAQNFEATISSIAANATIYYRAFAEVAGGTRFRGVVKTIAPLKPLASLNVTVDPAGGGTVGGMPAAGLRVGDAVLLTAVPASGFAFTGWTGGLTSAKPALAFAMPAALALTAHFSSSPILNATGRYRGLALTSPVTHASCGVVKVTITTKGAFSGQAVIGGAKFGFRGVFDADGIARFGTSSEATLPRSGMLPLLLRLNLPAGNATPTRVFGDVREAAGFLATIDAPRVIFTAAKTPVAPLLNPPGNWPGVFTSELAVTTPVANLAGYGWITTTVAKDGNARFVGALPDGSRWTSTQPLIADGSVPIYAALYGGKGSFFGVVNFSGSPVTLTSTAHWYRPANFSGPRFAGGWPDGIELELTGGAWTPFKLGVSWPLPGLVATSGAAHLWATDAGLSPALDWAVIFALKTGTARVFPTPSGASATFTPAAATGIFTGNFKTAPTATPFYFSGALRPGADRARGFFLTPTGSGPLTLLPQ